MRGKFNKTVSFKGWIILMLSFLLIFTAGCVSTAVPVKSSLPINFGKENIIESIESKNLDKVYFYVEIYPELAVQYQDQIISLMETDLNTAITDQDFYKVIQLYLNARTLYQNSEFFKNSQKMTFQFIDKLLNLENSYFYKLSLITYLKKYIPEYQVNFPEEPGNRIQSYIDIQDNMTTIYNDKGFIAENGYSRPDITMGTAFYIDYNLVVTNNHVIATAPDSYQEIYTLVNGQKNQGKVIYADPKYDIAVVKLKFVNKKFKYFKLNTSINLGDEIIACGNPLGLENTFTKGIVSNTSRQVLPLTTVYQADVALNPGNSGGPVVNKNYELVGIAFAGLLDYQNLNFILPIQLLLDTLYFSRTYSYLPRSWLGIYAELSEINYFFPDSSNYLSFKKNYLKKEISQGQNLQGKTENQSLNGTSIKIISINNIKFDNVEKMQKYIACLPVNTFILMKINQISETASGDENPEINEEKDVPILFLTIHRPFYPNLEIINYDQKENLFTPLLGIKVKKEGNKYYVSRILNELLYVVLNIEVNDEVEIMQLSVDYQNQYIILVLKITFFSKGGLTKVFNLVSDFESEWYI